VIIMQYRTAIPCKYITRQARRGAAAAELAILLPFVSLLFVAALDFCRVYYISQTIQNCAEAGAMYASGNATNPNGGSASATAVQAALAEGTSLSPPLQSSNVTVTYSGNTTQVTVQYQFKMLTSFLGNSGQVTLTRSVTMNMTPAAFQ
jgi:Flp pilus assembly protein TadG